MSFQMHSEKYPSQLLSERSQVQIPPGAFFILLKTPRSFWKETANQPLYKVTEELRWSSATASKKAFPKSVRTLFILLRKLDLSRVFYERGFFYLQKHARSKCVLLAQHTYFVRVSAIFVLFAFVRG